MPEVPDTAAPTAEVTADQSRAEYVQQVLGTARATLARSRANDKQFRERPVDAPGAPGRSRSSRPLAPRDRTLPPQTPPSRLDTWEQEREAVFATISGLRELCEALSNQIVDLRWRLLGTQFDNPRAAFSALKQWANEEAPLGQTRAGDATASATLNGDYAKPADGSM